MLARSLERPRVIVSSRERISKQDHLIDSLRLIVLVSSDQGLLLVLGRVSDRHVVVEDVLQGELDLRRKRVLALSLN